VDGSGVKGERTKNFPPPCGRVGGQRGENQKFPPDGQVWGSGSGTKNFPPVDRSGVQGREQKISPLPVDGEGVRGRGFQDFCKRTTIS